MANYRKEGDIAVITLKNPPVNALSHAVRSSIDHCLTRAQNDNDVSAVVLCGDGGVFCAGADIKEFSKNQHRLVPTIRDNVRQLEASDKPVVAAIAGIALGGGLEIALGCHYRIGNVNARIGFPEVLIGILPAAAGTQRLPRVAGVANSLDLILSGRHASARQALKMGILDKVVPGDVVEAAIDYAKSVAYKPVSLRRVSEMPVKGVEKADILFQEARKNTMKKSRGAIAPMNCLRAIEAAVNSPNYEEGLKKESELGNLLGTGNQAPAMSYAFFAERTAQKWELPGGKATYKSTKPLPVKTAAVIGCGTMGTGITISLITSNIPVVLLEADKKLLERGLKFIQQVFARNVKQRRMKADAAKKLISLVTPTLDYQQIKDVDLVIEAVFENMKLKKEIFAKLDAVCKPSAILCSNTSSLNIDEMASATKRPDKVVGTHFFAPAHLMKLLENIRGKDTSPETIATVMTLGKTIKKVPVLVGNCHGFVGNRMMFQYTSEASFLIEEGCLPEEVDRVLEDFGFPLGPLKVSDLSGLDVGWRIRQSQGITGEKVPAGTPLRYRQGQRYCPIPDMLCEQGHFGQKTGKGYYKYERPGAFQAMNDPDIKDMIVAYCRDHNIERRKIPYQEILERSLYCMINEGFKILEDGIATRMEDIDTIWLYGYAWPRHTGGPMYYATKMVGLPKVYERVCHYASAHPDIMHWQPSDLLKKMALQEAATSHL
ncbi:peroxisomal bifunctional enzyme-like isoform X1 [Ptychodera flava]|uniref:peroxisomal bifunctional enzyme-like isoform X1 n=1 Tax=Ptychodera flava TaxID=63121 RepID=UPI003969E2C1